MLPAIQPPTLLFIGKPINPATPSLLRPIPISQRFVLVEMGFIDNDFDVVLLENNQDDIARAIARGVTDYMRGDK